MVEAMTQITSCFVCETPLTGGRDTYGGIGEALCFLCYSDRLTNNKKVEQLKPLFEEYSRIATLHDDAEAEAAELQAEADKHHARLREVEKQMQALGYYGDPEKFDHAGMVEIKAA
jgi:hypothetical protein